MRQLHAIEYSKGIHRVQGITYAKECYEKGTYPLLTQEEIQSIMCDGHGLDPVECFDIISKPYPHNDIDKLRQVKQLHRITRLRCISSAVSHLQELDPEAYVAYINGTLAIESSGITYRKVR